MRILGVIFSIVFLFFGGAYFIFFTQSGNDIVKPYIENFASKKLQKDVKLSKFTLKIDHLSLQAEVANEASLVVSGDIDIFKQGFDLMYFCQAENLKTPVMLVREKLEVKGKAAGNVDDFIANGTGKAFGSNINFNVHLVDKKPLDGKIDAKGIDIAQVLEFIGKPRYSSGFVDIVANVKNENDILSGVANAIIREGQLASDLIKRDFQVDLPKNSSYVAKIDGNIEGDSLEAQSNIVSSLLTIQTTKTHINLKTQNVLSDFIVDIKDLTKLESIIKKKLYGPLKIYGDVKKEGKNMVINANSKLFDGDFVTQYKADTLQASLKNANLKKLFYMLGENGYGYGTINFEALLDDVSKKSRNGNMQLQVVKGEVVGSAKLKKDTGLELPPVTNVDGIITATIQGDNVEAKSDIRSTFIDIKTEHTKIDLVKQNVQSDFEINIDNLSYIGKLIKQELQGKIDAKGDMKFAGKLLSLNASTKSLGGNIDILFDKDDLKFNLKDVLAEKIARIVKKDNIIKAKIDASGEVFQIGSDAINGKVDYKLKDGVLYGAGLEALTEQKFPKISSVEMVGQSVIKKGVATFTNKLDSSLASVTSFNGKYHIPLGVLDSRYTLHVKDLSVLEFLTKTKLHGELKADGIIKNTKDNLYATFNAPLIGGQTMTVFDKGILKSNAKQISLKGLSELLDLPYVFDSNGDFNLLYDTKAKRGNYKLFMQEGRMVKNELSNIVLLVSGHDISSEIYKDTVLEGDINNDDVTYKLNMQGQKTFINIPNGILNLATKQTKANFNVKVKNADFKGAIKGDMSSPNISIDKSEYLKKKATKAIEKYVPKKQQEIVKGVLELLKQ